MSKTEPSRYYEKKAEEYCLDVTSGKIDACQYVKQACQRHLDDLARAESDPDYPYEFNPVLWDGKKEIHYRPAERRCAFSENLPHVKGKWKGQKLKLSMDQIFSQSSIWGWLKKKSKKRRFTTAYVEKPRKNGKSTELATGGLYALTEDGEKSAEVFSGATTEKQALEVFRTAWLMAHDTPGFLEYYGLSLGGTKKNPTSIYRLSDLSRFELLVGDPGDGASVHFAAIDEFHEHRTSNQIDTMETGTGAREQPLIYVITTAGDNISGPCYTMRSRMLKVLDGSLPDDSVFVAIYTIDIEDDYRDFKVWRKANPNYLISIEEDFLKKKHQETLTDVSKQNVNLRKHLNVWTNAGTAWMNMTKWAACGDPSLRLEDFKGLPCYMALDLASKIDICALILLFQPEPGNFVCFGRYYLPEDTIQKSGNDHYANWQKMGLLTVTSGAMTDFKFIQDDIIGDEENNAPGGMNKDFQILELAYDPREATYLINNIKEQVSFNCIEVTQGPQMMSEPMKELEGWVYDGKLRHDDNPIMNWMMGNVIKKQGRNSGPVKYYYPTKQKDSDKIDGPVSLIMAVGQAMLKGVPETSVYEERGILMFD